MKKRPKRKVKEHLKKKGKKEKLVGKLSTEELLKTMKNIMQPCNMPFVD